MSRRMDHVNVLLRQEISRVLAVKLRDPRLSSIVSVTHVDASADLRHAKVYISVLGDQHEKHSTLKALKSAAGFIHRSLRQHLDLKATPSLYFTLDDSIERGAELLQIIDEAASSPEEDEED